MPVVLRQLSNSDTDDVASLWQSATDRRRTDLGLEGISEPGSAMGRLGTFAVGLFDDDNLISMALAVPARADDGRSEHNVPGLAHISSVGTRPDRWSQGFGGQCVRAIMCQATRRGYARVQLWTHRSNSAARHLYEIEGFQHSGREKVDDYDETIVHYMRDLPPLPWRARPASRLVCLDPEGRILLLHWRDPLDGFQLWEPPGGGVEPGESPYDAVVREWREETGLPMPRMAGEPTLVARDMIFNGVRCVVDEAFFLGRTQAAGEPVPDGASAVEQDSYLGFAWVSRRHIDELEDPVEPDLVPVLDRLAS